MLGDIRKVEHIYIACGYTDLRRGIDGLAQIVQNQFLLDSCSNSLFLFCGRRRDRIKALLWEGDGFVLLYKRVETGCFQWPRTKAEMRSLSWQEFRWLLEGLSVDQPKAAKTIERVVLQGEVFHNFKDCFCSRMPRISAQNSPQKRLPMVAFFLYNGTGNGGNADE